jgi:hypothetical protein
MASDSENSMLKSLSSLIPGYSGYAESESRRSQDREIRKLLAQRLGECKAELSKRMKSLKNQNKFDVLSIADRLHGELDVAEQKTLAAYEGYTGWFNKNSVDSDKLREVVELDEGLVSLTDKIRMSIPDSIDDLAQIQELGDLIELYLQRFEKRRQILHG